MTVLALACLLVPLAQDPDPSTVTFRFALEDEEGAPWEGEVRDSEVGRHLSTSLSTYVNSQPDPWPGLFVGGHHRDPKSRLPALKAHTRMLVDRTMLRLVWRRRSPPNCSPAASE